MGYLKDKENKRYHKDPNKQEDLNRFFNMLQEITTVEELGKVLKDFGRKLGCPELRLLNTAQDPFYAGYDLSLGENKLPHVQPYIELEIFKYIQETCSGIFKEYLDRVEQLERQNTYLPVCGLCLKPLHYRSDVINNSAFYSCSRKHPKVSIDFVDLTKIIDLVLLQIMDNLNSQKLIADSVERFRRIRKQIDKEIQNIDYQLTDILDKILLKQSYSDDWKENEVYKKLSHLKGEKETYLQTLNENELLLKDNQQLVKAVEEHIKDRSKTNPSLLVSMFINKISVYPNEVEMEVQIFDYLKDLQAEIIYTGDASA
ncbi:hypothetical protein MST22_12155 [Virgibacillus halodenitrificans]|uniref:hypothetical protein n=1 Tax=Virgibacillus halodenitrificans TaxID=1482 RepID=UPI001FB38CD7|nr:hypothetical protein [Virgibacillus halodenitrificans]MCJ0931905.1 hypothetical protein [Virgibacillus halodenitrificans]